MKGDIVVNRAGYNSRGVYTCEGTNKNGHAFYAESEVFIIGMLSLTYKIIIWCLQ